MNLVLDASVLVGLITEERFSTAAREAVARERLIAPDLVLGEAANALWRKVRLGMMPADLARRAAAGVPHLFAELVPPGALLPMALDLALRRDHPVYDCFYVALAMRGGMPLLTADRRLAERFAGDADVRLLA